MSEWNDGSRRWAIRNLKSRYAALCDDNYDADGIADSLVRYGRADQCRAIPSRMGRIRPRASAWKSACAALCLIGDRVRAHCTALSISAGEGARSDAHLCDLRRDGKRHLDALKWGLVPYFTKDLKKARKPINARDDNLFQSQSPRNSRNPYSKPLSATIASFTEPLN